MADYVSATLRAAWHRAPAAVGGKGAGAGARAPRWTLDGQLLLAPMVTHVYLFATAPANRMATFSGSGLPFPHEHFPPTQGPIRVPVSPTGAFSVTVLEPNAYHAPDGQLRGPEVCLRIAGDTHRVSLPAEARIPSRSLNYMHEMTPGAFDEDISAFDVRSQEAILRSRAYPAAQKCGA